MVWIKKIILLVVLFCLPLNLSAAKKQTYPLELKPSFISLAIKEAKIINKQYGIPVSVIVAQAIYESNFGKSSLAKANNFFGLKALSGWSGPVVYKNSCDGTFPYRKYSTMSEGFRGYAQFLKQDRYKSAFKYKQDPDKFLKTILSSGYCPSSQYYTDVKGIINRYNLKKYDIKESSIVINGENTFDTPELKITLLDTSAIYNFF